MCRLGQNFSELTELTMLDRAVKTIQGRSTLNSAVPAMAAPVTWFESKRRTTESDLKTARPDETCLISMPPFTLSNDAFVV